MVSGVPGEESQDVGRDGLLEAKRWLNMTTRVASIWTHRDKPMSELLGFAWPHGGSSFSFDVGGQFRGDALDRQSFIAEVKNYKNEGDLPAHYRDFLAKAYVALLAHPDRCDNFLWISWAPFKARKWDEHASTASVEAAVLHDANRQRVFGTTDLDEARAAINAEAAVRVAERVWLLTLSHRQKDLVLTAKHYGEVIKMITAEAV